MLADNAGQALALSLDGLRSARRYEEFVALVDDMTGAGLLNRQDESVPSREELLASPHRERGLPRPLLCVLLGYSKMSAFQLLLETDFPDSAAGRPFLDGYFPRLLRERFADHFQEHVLRREIVATGAVNYLINRGGIALLPRLEQGARNGIGEAVAAWIEVDRESEAAGAARQARSPRAARRGRSRRRSSRSRTRSRPRRASGSRARRRRGRRRRCARSEIGSACERRPACRDERRPVRALSSARGPPRCSSRRCGSGSPGWAWATACGPRASCSRRSWPAWRSATPSRRATGGAWSDRSRSLRTWRAPWPCCQLSLVLALPALGAWLAPALAAFQDRPLLLHASRAAVAFGLMLLPATAMGATLPLLTRALAPHSPRFGMALGRLYGWNTLGGVAGAIASETLLVPQLGLTRTAFVAAALNLAAVVVALALDRGLGAAAAVPVAPAEAAPHAAGASRSRLARLLAAAFLAGGILLALEVVWFRFLQLFVFGTELAFSLMLATVLAGIALGGLVAAAWLRQRAEATRALAVLALLAGVATVTSYAGFEPAHAALGRRGGTDALARAGADAADVARLRRALHAAGRRYPGRGDGRRRRGRLADARQHPGGDARRAARRARAAARAGRRALAVRARHWATDCSRSRCCRGAAACRGPRCSPRAGSRCS